MQCNEVETTFLHCGKSDFTFEQSSTALILAYDVYYPHIPYLMDSNLFNPKLTVIVAVYNNPRWLRLILDALCSQHLHSLKPEEIEIVIADDGSSEENVSLLRHYMNDIHPEKNIIHAWHADEGWRKNIALNNALRSSKGEYVVFVDGDCIPHPEFLEDHWRLRKPGVVMGGRRIESGKAVTEMIESWDELPKNYFSLVRKCVVKNILTDKSASPLAQIRRSIRFPFIFGSPIGLKSQGILGANFGIYRRDLERVNGFDERYLDPGTGEDCDLDVRLANAGIRHLKASHYALMVHRHHNRLDWSSERNAEFYRQARENKITYVETGLRHSDL